MGAWAFGSRRQALMAEVQVKSSPCNPESATCGVKVCGSRVYVGFEGLGLRVWGFRFLAA